MDNKDYEELSEFTCSQYQSYLNTFGDIKAPANYLTRVFQRLSRREAMFDKYFRSRDQMSIKVSRAIDTMPHGWLWKKFHRKLWLKCQEELKHRKELEEVVKSELAKAQAQPVTPEVLPPAPQPKPDIGTYFPDDMPERVFFDE